VLEAGEQHRRSEVHDLVWLLYVTLGGLAGGQVRKPWLVELEVHKLRDGQHAITEVEAALERVLLILDAVTCKVEETGRPDPFGHLVDCCGVCNDLDSAAEPLRLGHRLYALQLPLNAPQSVHARVSGTVLSHKEHIDVGGRDRHSPSLSAEQC
jgi:hypothetical protein